MSSITIDKDICKGCSMCIKACPKKIIKLSQSQINSKGYYVAELTDKDACIGCASCAMMCPDVAITVER